MFPSTLVSPQDFHGAYSHPSDGSTRIIPIAAGRTAHIPFFNANHIPGSIFFNMDTIRTQETPYPLMLPTPRTFSTSLSTLGVKPSDVVVIYDALEIGTYNAPRVAWMFRVFGHRRVHVLNNFRLYAELGYPVGSGDVESASVLGLSYGSAAAAAEPGLDRGYPLTEVDSEMVVSYAEMQKILSERDQHLGYQILDSRTNPLFTGLEGYSDPSIQRGHIPGSMNIPLSTVLNEHGAIKAPSELKALFEKIGVSEKKPVIVSCNSGVTAATVEVALAESGYMMPKRLYDGSWMEWGRRATPELIATGSE